MSTISLRKLYPDQSMIRDDGRVQYLVDVEDAQIWMRTRNLRGEPNKFGAKDRSFDIWIDDIEVVEKLRDDGWNVREYVPKSDEYEPRYHLSILLKYRNNEGDEVRNPPKVYMKSGNRRKPIKLDEETVGTIDDVEIDSVDLTFRPYNWEVNGKTGVKAYLDTMVVRINESGLAAKYAEMEYPEE